MDTARSAGQDYDIPALSGDAHVQQDPVIGWDTQRSHFRLPKRQ
jgi:hypothetical protein